MKQDEVQLPLNVCGNDNIQIISNVFSHTRHVSLNLLPLTGKISGCSECKFVTQIDELLSYGVSPLV